MSLASIQVGTESSLYEAWAGIVVNFTKVPVLVFDSSFCPQNTKEDLLLCFHCSTLVKTLVYLYSLEVCFGAGLIAAS